MVIKLLNKLSLNVKSLFLPKMTFYKLRDTSPIFLYAGDVPQSEKYHKFIGLSINNNDYQHIKHDIREKMPLNDCCVDIYQSEDVFEHIEPELLPEIMNEIYRILKKGGVFRLAIPDYRCDILHLRTQKDEDGGLVFDPYGGGSFKNGKVVDGGHLWFPKYETVKEILSKTQFIDINFLHYYDEQGRAITKKIDYRVGHVMRTPDYDERIMNPYRPMSIVVDCIK